MDSIDFTPNEKYLELVALSNERKTLLGLSGVNYNQLRKLKLYQKHGYELHHIVPRYRFKGKTNQELNIGENIALLTIREHLLAHLYLTQFETGKFFYSARMAFIQLWSFSLSKEIPDLEAEDFDTLLNKVEKSRKEYFGSAFHVACAKKLGNWQGRNAKRGLLKTLNSENIYYQDST